MDRAAELDQDFKAFANSHVKCMHTKIKRENRKPRVYSIVSHL